MHWEDAGHETRDGLPVMVDNPVATASPIRHGNNSQSVLGNWVDVDEGDEQDLEEGELEEYVEKRVPSLPKQSEIMGTTPMAVSSSAREGMVVASNPGRVEVLFPDIAVVDQSLQGNGGFTTVEKRQPVTKGTEKQQAIVAKARETSLARLASL
ncbi:hypothetical protein NE237_021560 [Protea cynaroides]|uniref:Uncharacterized protein n=1 Tax=Protea cynaroides TaxID=273540 RepID=A0A9Q0H9C7_9MAGN|nr:hypothetical protein NE237_021560 [Protea cynaroides]